MMAESALEPQKDLSPIEPIAGPAWNNSSEYPSMESNEFRLDVEHFEELRAQIAAQVTALKAQIDTYASIAETERESLIKGLQTLADLEEQAWVIFQNLYTYVHCTGDIDATNTEAQRRLADLKQRAAELEAVLTPVHLFLNRAPDEALNRYLSHPHTAPKAFALKRDRELAHIRLSEAEETQLVRMRTHAIDAFGQLYSQISGVLRPRVATIDGRVEELGLAQAAGVLRDTDEAKRRAAWLGIQEAWKTHETSGAAILNGLAGWRIEECRLRSRVKPFGFLDGPIHHANLRRESLNAMMEAVQSQVEIGRRAARAMASVMGKPKLDPWDLLAGAPATTFGGESRRPYKDGLQMIHDAFAAVDPSLSDFVDMMNKNWWIEGRVLPNKRQGAYCTRFSKSRTPRVFQTYMGSINDIRTLAHELGHAYHGWVVRDLPLDLQNYPMTLAETASLFAETALGDFIGRSTDPALAFANAWQEASSALSLLLNIPARYEFEKSFYERREKSAYCTPDELGEFTDAAWRKWYGDTLTQSERQFWITKLHFSIAGVSFYNFPYTFGALFALSIYARRTELGDRFLPMYVALLRDTGAMTAEDLAQKHLGEDITRPEFWLKSLSVMDAQVKRFETLAKSARLDH